MSKKKKASTAPNSRPPRVRKAKTKAVRNAPRNSTAARKPPDAKKNPRPSTRKRQMADSTLEQRVAWLQQGLQDIGKLCLQLGGGALPADGQTARTDTTGNVSTGTSSGGQTTTPPGPSGDDARPAQNAIAGASSLNTFLAQVQDLTPAERLIVVDAAIAMLSQVFVHLPLKRSMYGIDPVQRLRLLRQRLNDEVTRNIADGSARGFHDEMIDIFHSLRDLHTNYLLPAGYRGKTAFLPFLLQEYFEGNPRQRKYVVTRLLPGFAHATFAVGATVTHWNGVPIDRAVERIAAREAGSNPDASHARGLEALTLRSMLLSAPPDEAWVIIGYTSVAGEQLEVRLEWQVTSPNAPVSGVEADDPSALGSGIGLLMGFDAQTIAVQRAKKSLFFPDEIGKEEQMAAALATTPTAVALGASPMANEGTASFDGDDRRRSLRRMKSQVRYESIKVAQQSFSEAATTVSTQTAADPNTTSLLPDFFSFKTVRPSTGTFGYIRIFSFMAFDANAFVAEFIRILGLLPTIGLIIDVRGNGGGNILAGEQLLQTLTPGPITPENFHFINSPGTDKLCGAMGGLSQWQRSIRMGFQNSESFSQGFPLTPPERANELGRQYPGQVVLIIDALCYSTTDIFAAGFQDHKIGKILGTAGHTGAGGANVWTYDAFAAPLGFVSALPKGVSFRSAIRRSTRVGPNMGLPLEDYGVEPDERHFMTLNDVLNENDDLIEHAANILMQP